MKAMHRLNEYLIVPVPEGSTKHYVSIGGDVLYWTRPDFDLPSFRIIPIGRWEVVCKGTEVDEVMAGEMVASIDCGGTLPEGYGGDYIESLHYLDYLDEPHQYNCYTALDSFQSYLTAHNLTASSIVVLKPH